MAYISFEEANNIASSADNTFAVDFFSLKNDGDEAIVRILHDSVDSFNILTTHPILVDNKNRKVNCIRTAKEPIDNCPLCKAGYKVENKIFINILQYETDATGAVVPKAKVWERSIAYAKKLKDLITEYGPLSECIFKIKRSGKPGSIDTTYSILYGNPMIYNVTVYPKDTSAFDGYNVLGSMVMNKNFDELSEYVSTGAFPIKEKVEQTTITEAASISNTAQSPVASQFSPAIAPQQQFSATTTTANRPVRHY